MTISLTQKLAFEVSPVVFLLGSALVGSLAASFVHWTYNLSRNLETWRMKNQYRKEIKTRDMIDKFYHNGEIAFSGGKQDKAQSCFEKILQKNPEHLGALYYLGSIFRECDKVADAKRLHKKGISIKPDDPRFLYALALDYMAAEQSDKVLATLKKVPLLDQAALPLLYKLRDYHIKKDDWEKAYATQKSILPLLQDAKTLEIEENKFSEIFFSKAMELYKNGQTSDAIAELKRAKAENNRSLPVYVALGDIHMELNDSKQAVKVWKAGFDNTGEPVCLQRIQKVYQGEQYFKDLVKMFESAINSSKGRNRETLELMLVSFYDDNNKPEEAIKLLRSTNISLTKSSLLTKIYRTLNKKDETAKATQEIIEQAQESIHHYSCRECRTFSLEWHGNCLNCNAWDSIRQSVNLNSSKLLSNQMELPVKAA